ncbi:MAG: hypothetical protein V7744_20830 [Pseudomonadales bacterium]
MSERYMIEVKQELITPVMVEANSQREAIEKVFKQEGHAGDIYHGDTEVISIRCLDS